MNSPQGQKWRTMYLISEEQRLSEERDIMVALALVRDVYDQPNGAYGGSCHMVLDDENIEDQHIDWVFEHVRMTDCERQCMDALRKLSKLNRAVVLNRFHRGSPAGQNGGE